MKRSKEKPMATLMSATVRTEAFGKAAFLDMEFRVPFRRKNARDFWMVEKVDSMWDGGRLVATMSAVRLETKKGKLSP
jgi:hypothetical protein